MLYRRSALTVIALTIAVPFPVTFKIERAKGWECELRDTPRRMKRPLPASKPAIPRPARRPCY